MFNALLISFVGLEWYVSKSFEFIRVLPLGMVICSSVIILYISSFCSNLSEVLRLKLCRCCASCIHAISSADGFSRKLFIVLFR